MSELHYVLAVTALIWAGLFLYLVRIDVKVKEAERREEV